MARGVEAADDVLRMKAFGGRDHLGVKDTSEGGAIRNGEAVDQFPFKDITAEGVGAWLEHGPEAPAGIGGAQSAQRFADGGRVVGEVVDDGDAVNFGADFKPAANAAEAGEGFDDGRSRHSQAGSEGCCGGGVEGVVFAGHGEGEFRPGLTVVENAPVAGAVCEAQIGETPSGVSAEAVALTRAEGSADALGDVV